MLSQSHWYQSDNLISPSSILPLAPPSSFWLSGQDPDDLEPGSQGESVPLCRPSGRHHRGSLFSFRFFSGHIVKGQNRATVDTQHVGLVVLLTPYCKIFGHSLVLKAMGFAVKESPKCSRPTLPRCEVFTSPETATD